MSDDLPAELIESQRELAGAYAAYQRLMGERGLIDHGDQVGLALSLLRDHPPVRIAVASRYRYLLVDEFQDMNPSQLEVIRHLAGDSSNVTAVGDPDQAIYTFRGAAADNAEWFETAFPVGAHPVAAQLPVAPAHPGCSRAADRPRPPGLSGAPAVALRSAWSSRNRGSHFVLLVSGRGGGWHRRGNQCGR